MTSTWEKFQGATLTLVGSRPIKDRLLDAYRNHLVHVREEELPKELRMDFRAVAHALTREAPVIRGEDALRATVRKLSVAEADNVALEVVKLFSAVARGAGVQGGGSRAPATVIPTPLLALHAAEA